MVSRSGFADNDDIRPKAFIIPRKDVPGDQALGRKLLAYAKENKVRYKWLVEIELFRKYQKTRLANCCGVS